MPETKQKCGTLWFKRCLSRKGKLHTLQYIVLVGQVCVCVYTLCVGLVFPSDTPALHILAQDPGGVLKFV